MRQGNQGRHVTFILSYCRMGRVQTPGARAGMFDVDSGTAQKFHTATKIKFPPQNEIFSRCDVVASPAGEELHLK
jgi:hypothetical protein